MYKIYLDEEDNFLTKVAVYENETPLHVQLYKFDIDYLEDALIALGVEYQKGILVEGDLEYLIRFETNDDYINIKTVFEYIELQVYVFLAEYFHDTYGRAKFYYQDKLTALIACKLIPLFEEYDTVEFENFTDHIMEYEKNNPIDSDERTEYEPYRKYTITPLFNVKFEFPKDERENGE